IAATQELVQKIVESKKNAPPSKRRKGAKNAATAAKVALMKLKMHASGDKDLKVTVNLHESSQVMVDLHESS
uniref:Uncharacterized protein n=1 Tax=Sinocyclocheilus grahami TaxID=75366 RepID=A0A672KSR2_SINGR